MQMLARLHPHMARQIDVRIHRNAGHRQLLLQLGNPAAERQGIADPDGQMGNGAAEIGRRLDEGASLVVPAQVLIGGHAGLPVDRDVRIG
jgi:hypothetical protein